METERELVEVGLEVPRLHAALVGAKKPALGQRGDPVDAGEEFVGRQSGPGARQERPLSAQEE